MSVSAMQEDNASPKSVQKDGGERRRDGPFPDS